MPYPTLASLPPNVKRLPAMKRRQWRHVWNSTFARTGDEGRAFASAWSVVGGAPKVAKAASEPVSQLLYVPLTKKDPKERIVGGYATTEAVDAQGEIVDLRAVEEAWPDYAKFSNLREMHAPWAAGKVIYSEFRPDGVYIEGKVVDNDAWRKVEEGVYNGFSLGGQRLEVRTDVSAPRGRVTKVKIHEISLVDRPANPEATFSLVKFEKVDTVNYPVLVDGEIAAQQHGSAKPVAPIPGLHPPVENALEDRAPSRQQRELMDDVGELIEWDMGQVVTLDKRKFDPDVGGGVDRDKLPSGDFAGPQRSFPIVSPKDVSDAVRSLGRTKHNKAQVKSRIISIAQRKGGAYVAALPREWRKEIGAEADMEKADMSHSHEDVIREVREALARKHPAHHHLATHSDHAITTDLDGNFHHHPYTIGPDTDGDGGFDVELGPHKPVERQFVPARMKKMADQFARSVARHGVADLERIQKLHDESVALGAACDGIDKTVTIDRAMDGRDVNQSLDGYEGGKDRAGLGSAATVLREGEVQDQNLRVGGVVRDAAPPVEHQPPLEPKLESKNRDINRKEKGPDDDRQPSLGTDRVLTDASVQGQTTRQGRVPDGAGTRAGDISTGDVTAAERARGGTAVVVAPSTTGNPGADSAVPGDVVPLKPAASVPYASEKPGAVGTAAEADAARFQGGNQVYVEKGDMTKLVSSMGETFAKIVRGEVVEPLEKRIKALEDTPAPGGPVLSPGQMADRGIRTVEKTGPGSTSTVIPNTELELLKKLHAEETNPILKDEYGKKLALAEVRAIQGGR